MIEPTQILFISVVTILTILMVVIGWQVFQILSEVRKMLMKFNTMVDGAVSVTGSLGKSVENLSGFTEGVKAAFHLFSIFKKKDKDDHE